VRSYKRALLVQYEEAGLQNNAGISRVRAHFKSLMEEFAPMVRESYPDALALGSGGCRICPECAYPNNPCRHPDRMIQSVSAFCIDAGQACGLAGLPCWRDGYISFTGIFLTG
jgi:predicted metal-binding protein